MIDLGGEHRARASHGGGDRDQAGTGSEIEHEATCDYLRLIEQVAGQRLAAGPGKGPERRRHGAARQAVFARLPDRGDFGRQMEADFRRERRRGDRGIAADEQGGVHSAVQSTWPATIPASTSQPTARFERNLARQSAG